MTKSPKICIIGSEGWGSAIATAVCKNVLNNAFDPQVNLYVYDEIVRSNYLAEIINERHENVKYLPGIQLPENLVAVNDLLYAAQEADILVFATPHDFVKSYCNILAGNVKSDAYALSLIKGFEHIGNGEIDLYSQTITKKLGIPCYSMMNANCAMEMAQGKLCEITIGCNNQEHAKQLSTLIQTDNCMVVVVDDVHGVELCNTLKDLVALSAGFIDGLRLGDNARVACLHVGLKEMMRFIKNFNPTTKVSTCFESCGLANSVATVFADKNATVAKTLVTAQKTIQEIESALLNGRKLLGPIIAEDIYFYLEKQEMQEEYPLFSIVHQICQNKVPPEAIVDTIRNHPDLRSFTVAPLQKDEFLTFPLSLQSVSDNVMESIAATKQPLVNKISLDDLELEMELDNGDFGAAGFWHPDSDHDKPQKNYMEQAMEPLKNSQVAAGALNKEPEKGSVEFCFEMGSKKDTPDICFHIKDNILETTTIKEDVCLMGSRFNPIRSEAIGKASNLERPGEDLIGKGMACNNKGISGQFHDSDNFDKHDERKWHAFEKKGEIQSQPSVASSWNGYPNSTDSTGYYRLSNEEEDMNKMQLFEKNPAEDELVNTIRKKEREALKQNRLRNCRKQKRLMRKGSSNRKEKKNRKLFKKMINGGKSYYNVAQTVPKSYKYDYKISINSRKIPICNSPKDGLDARAFVNVTDPPKDKQPIATKSRLKFADYLAMKLNRFLTNTNISCSSHMPSIESANSHSFVESSPNFTNVEGSFVSDSPTDFNQGALDTTCRARDHDSDFQTYQQPPFNKSRKNLVENGENEFSMRPRVTTDDLRLLGIEPDIFRRRKVDKTQRTSELHKSKKYVNRKRDLIHQAENIILDNEISSEILSKEKSARDALSDKRPTYETTIKKRSDDKLERDDGSEISEKYRKNGNVQMLEDEMEESLLDDRVPKYIESQENEWNKPKEDRAFVRFTFAEEKYPESKSKTKGELSQQKDIRDEYNKIEEKEEGADTTLKEYNNKDNVSIESKKREELLMNEEPLDEGKFPKENQVRMKGAETYPLDTAPSEIESEPKNRSIRYDEAADWNEEDKIHQSKFSLLTAKGNALTSEWDWLLDNDKFDEALEHIKSKKVGKSDGSTNMSKYRNLLEFIATIDDSNEKTKFDGGREKPEIDPDTNMEHIRYSWPILTKSLVDPPTGFEDLIKITQSEANISDPETEYENHDARTDELAASSKKDWEQKKILSESMLVEKPLHLIEEFGDRAEELSKEETECIKRFSKIMAKGRHKEKVTNEQLVDYYGTDPYKKNRDMLKYLQNNLQDSYRGSKILAKPFHPPINPRVRTPRPPFDGRDHEYHTLNFRPLPIVQRRIPQRPWIPLSKSMHESGNVSKMPRHPLKLPPSMIRSSLVALELGLFGALLSRYRGGRK